MQNLFGTTQRRKVFISYYHKDDQGYRDHLEKFFGHLFISKSVQPGDINTDVSTEYIKRLIQGDYISDASVVLVLLSPKTLCRMHVDWEISAALNGKVGGYSGVAGIVLPTLKPTSDSRYDHAKLPARLVDNLVSGFSKLWTWEHVVSSNINMMEMIEDTFSSRINRSDKINNSRIQMGKNTCE